MSELPLIIRNGRNELGLSQVRLAHLTGISLPSIQNIEAGRGNPSIDTLNALFEVLGLQLNYVNAPADWSKLAACGAPISARDLPGYSPNSAELIKILRLCCLELSLETRDKPDLERRREAVQALLLALKRHYPHFYRKHCVGKTWLPDLPKLNGRLIRLSRQALASVSVYL